MYDFSSGEFTHRTKVLTGDGKQKQRIFASFEKYYIPQYKKYFVLESYGAPFSISIDTNSLCRSPKVYIVVNKDDMNNPKLGSKENPVVVLWWYTDSNYKFYEVSEKDYKNSVKEYLTYCQSD